MVSLRLILVGILLALVAYQLAPSSKLLDVQEGDAIVVTGSHTGIGKHAALTLAKEGYTVFSCVRKLEHGDELIAAAKKYNIDPSKVKPIILDVTKMEQIEAAVETVTEFVGDRGLYGLFNNAGVAPSHPNGLNVEYFPMDEYRWTFEVNYFGLLQTTKAFLPLIRRRKGRIINNTSIAGFFAAAFASAYAGSKYAVEALSDSLRHELHPHGVFVSVLEPGYIQTPIFQPVARLKDFDPQGVYAEAEKSTQRQFAKGALHLSQPPRVTSEAVVHAMRAVQPKTRYVVGGASGVVRILASLPDSWADAILCLGEGKNMITDKEIDELMKSTDANEFEL